MDVDDEGKSTTLQTSPQTPTPIRETLIAIQLESHKYQFRCVNSAVALMATSQAMDAHIQAVHTKKVFLCSYCDFTTYNLDSMQRHGKGHK